MRICELKRKEVINISDCKRLGYVGDVDFDVRTGCVPALIVPGPGCICGFLGHEKEYVVEVDRPVDVSQNHLLILLWTLITFQRLAP